MRKFISIILLLNLTACATIFSGSNQTINVKAVDSKTNEALTEVACTVREGNGVVHIVNSNPGTVSVSRGTGALDISCKRNGYTQGQTMAGDSFNAVTLVNILFWPGFLVDAVTGSYKKYPSHFVITMNEIAHSNK